MSITLADKIAEGTRYKILRYNRHNCKVKSKCYAVTYKDILGQTIVTKPMTSYKLCEWLRVHKDRDNVA